MPYTATPNGPLPWIATTIRFVSTYAFELVLIGLILLMCISRGLKIGIVIHDPEKETAADSALSLSGVIPFDFSKIFNSEKPALLPASGRIFANDRSKVTETPVARNVSLQPYSGEGATAIDIQAEALPGIDNFNSVSLTDDPAPHISNLTLVLSPDYAIRKNLPEYIVTAKKERVRHYVERFASIAQTEMRQYGVPASITLAQGLLESNAGDSKLARNSLNHFGIKCRSKCLGCTCRNYGDDTRYDMFRVFDTVAESFREHSILLSSHRYKKLHRHGTDYKKWAHGLKACGYATDKRYAQKLIKIIEELGLDAYDQAFAA